MKIFRTRRNGAMTLTEVMVSTTVMMLIFGTMAFLTFVTGRSTLQVREQALSQMQSASAAERVCNTLRNAAAFRTYGTDDMATTLTRVLFDIPDSTQASGFKTGIVAFVAPSGNDKSDGIVKIFENSASYNPGTVHETKATWEYKGIQKFSVVFNSTSWITISTSYNYRGFRALAGDIDEDLQDDYRLAGEFLTDVIAKNHHPGESAQYAETTSTLFTL